MSAASRQQTCAACGRDLAEVESTGLEPLIDPIVRYVAVCWSCTTFIDSELAHE